MRRDKKLSLSGQPLSPRELMILELVVAGLTVNEIAEALCIEPRTVGTHLERLEPKMFAPNRTTLAVLAIMHGLVDLQRVRDLWGIYRPYLLDKE